MTPDYCANCATLNLPCASGLPDDKGRLCPQAEHACRTLEGAAVWDAVSRSGGWAGGGMTPRRVDRAAVRARLDGVEGWIVEGLIDAFEPAALAAAAKSSEAERNRRKGLKTRPTRTACADDHGGR